MSNSAADRDSDLVALAPHFGDSVHVASDTGRRDGAELPDLDVRGSTASA